MKNNLDAGSSKTRRLNFCICNKLTVIRAFAGVLSITLLLFSLAGLLAVLNGSRALAAPSAVYTKSATQGNLSSQDTSTLTTTSTSSPTVTTTSTATSTTATPTTTSTVTPTTTTTTTPSPTPTATTTTTSTPASTATPSPTPKASPTSTAPPASTTLPTSTATLSSTPAATSSTTASATPGTTATVTAAAATQDSGSSQTPTTSSTGGAQHTSQDRQNGGFPVLALIIGLAACTFTISVLLFGWYFLRKKLLPVSSSKLPSSGAGPWSRVRTDALAGNTYANSSSQQGGANSWVPASPSSWRHDAVTSTGNPVPGSGWSTPAPNTGTFTQPNSAFSPTTGSFAPSSDSYFPANSDFVPATNPSNASTSPTASVALANNYGQVATSPGQFPSTSPISYIWTTDAPAKPLRAKPVRLLAMSDSDSQADLYDPRNSSQVGSDLNGSNVQEMISHYSQALQEQENEDR